MNTYYSNGKRKYAELSYESKYLLDPKYMTKRDMQHYYRYYNMTKNRTQFKKVIFVIFFICFMSYVFIDFNLKTKLLRLRDHFDFVGRVDAEYNITQAYFVDTPGCRMPYFNVSDNTIVQFMFKPKNFTCHKALTRVSPDNATLWLNMNDSEILERYNVEDLDQVRCFYYEVRRKTDQEQNQHMSKIYFKLRPETPIVIRPDYEFISIECTKPDGEMFYKDFHFFALDKARNQTTVRRKVPKFRASSQQTPAKRPTASEPKVSVMVLGLDSVSHLNFLRQMKQSTAYIHDHLSYVEFWGYNNIGDNAYPNLIPTLTGLDESDLDISCRTPAKNTHFDQCAFLWKRFKEAGYQTVYAEDVAQMSLFNYLRPGFKKQPTDYYLYPLVQEMEKHISYMEDGNVDLCKAGRRSVDIVLEMIQRLMPLLRRQLFFSFFWLVTITHDFWNMPQLLDSDVAQLLSTFVEAGILNNTVLFLMSDHGMRWGSFRETYQGMMEERQPLLIALYPPWMRQRYPTAIANMEVNSKRLTTPFDLHYTMLDLSDLRSLRPERIAQRNAELQEAEIMPRSISLFLSIPETRSCDLAGIASHWCTCHQKQELPTNDANVQHAARYIVKLINAKLKQHPQCRMLYLNSILDAIVAATHKKMLKEVSRQDYGIDITVRVQTKPGLGEFESTVRMSTYSTSLIGTISRINLYGSQSYCIDDYALKMFCYCHR